MESGSDMIDWLIYVDECLIIKQAEDRIYTVYARLRQASRGHGCTTTNSNNASIFEAPLWKSHVFNYQSDRTTSALQLPYNHLPPNDIFKLKNREGLWKRRRPKTNYSLGQKKLVLYSCHGNTHYVSYSDATIEEFQLVAIYLRI